MCFDLEVGVLGVSVLGVVCVLGVGGMFACGMCM